MVCGGISTYATGNIHIWKGTINTERHTGFRTYASSQMMGAQRFGIWVLILLFRLSCMHPSLSPSCLI